MKQKIRQKIINLIDFAIELKNEVRNSGRTNVIPIRIIEEFFKTYEINRIELEKLKNAL